MTLVSLRFLMNDGFLGASVEKIAQNIYKWVNHFEGLKSRHLRFTTTAVFAILFPSALVATAL